MHLFRKPERIESPVGAQLNHGGTWLQQSQNYSKSPLFLWLMDSSVFHKHVQDPTSVISESADLDSIVHRDQAAIQSSGIGNARYGRIVFGRKHGINFPSPLVINVTKLTDCTMGIGVAPAAPASI